MVPQKQKLNHDLAKTHTLACAYIFYNSEFYDMWVGSKQIQVWYFMRLEMKEVNSAISGQLISALQIAACFQQGKGVSFHLPFDFL